MRYLTILGAVGLVLGLRATAGAETLTFTAAEIKSAMAAQGAPLSNGSYQWGLFGVNARPTVTGGTFTITGASTNQAGWGVEAPSSVNWNTYGTNCAAFYDRSGSNSGVAATPLYMIMDVSQNNFESYSYNGTGGWVGSWSPVGGTFYASGYDGGKGGTNVVTAVSDSSIFSFDFTLGFGASWNGGWEFLVGGSRYNLGTSAAPGSWTMSFGNGDDGGLNHNTGSGYQVPEPLTLVLLGIGGIAECIRRRRMA